MKSKRNKISELPAARRSSLLPQIPQRALYIPFPFSFFLSRALANMAKKVDPKGVTTVEQGVYPVPNIPMKELLGCIP
jgi:hypothetical protein